MCELMIGDNFDICDQFRGCCEWDDAIGCLGAMEFDNCVINTPTD